MEASALQAPASLARARISVGAPLLRLRSDEQLLALFRTGNEDAFRVIHDRYRQRLFAYTRQMLPGSTQDAEDALQDVFVRAYAGLRANDRELALRPWLYRVAHNRCVDEMRRPVPPPPAILQQTSAHMHDPIAQVEQRESLRRLVADLRRLPAQQRSALLMRELGGMSYVEIATAMEVSVPAVKSLLVRARIGLTLAVEARDTACIEIRDELTLAHDRGVRASGTVRRHLTDCAGCREFKSDLSSSRRQLAALAPTLGPIGLLANVLGIGGGGGAATSGAASGGATAAATGGATATTGALISGGTAASAGSLAAGATHIGTLLAAAVVTAGGAVAIQHSVATTPHHASVTRPAAIAPVKTVTPVTPAPYGGETYVAPGRISPSEPTKPSATKLTTKAKTSASASKSKTSTSISGGDNLVPTAALTSGTTEQATTVASGTTSGTSSTSTTGTSGTAASGAGTSTTTGATSSGTTASGTGTGTGSTDGTTHAGTTGSGTGTTGSGTTAGTGAAGASTSSGSGSTVTSTTASTTASTSTSSTGTTGESTAPSA
jgi:RNA polymerase sigma factor (sigma-70 family)